MLPLLALRNLYREINDASRFLSTTSQKDIVFFSEDRQTWTVFEGYIKVLESLREEEIHYITSAADDPVFHYRSPQLRTYLSKRSVPFLVPRISSSVAMFTMPDLGTLHVRKPPPPTRSVYVFHSLVSTHRVYREGAFDNYDDIFCAGPHHITELQCRFETLKQSSPRLHPVGYYKLDRIISKFESYSLNHSTPKVLIAPTWGPGNLIEVCGLELIQRLIPLGLEIVIRPHPCFFLKIYPKGKKLINKLISEFRAHPNIRFDFAYESEASFYDADVMISDWSGAAFEYALGTLRPVIFLDVPPKTRNPNWSSISPETFEASSRTTCGEILSLENQINAGRLVESMLGNREPWSQRLRVAREQLVFNLRKSAEIGANIISQQIDAGC